jgi:hypothetical protein
LARSVDAREPPVYRPFALLSFGVAVLAGIPLGLRALAWLYAGFDAVSLEWVLLHANLQIYGFFATLIAGVAPHLIARFTGTPLVKHRFHDALWVALGAALIGRIAGTVLGSGAKVLAAAVVQTLAFAAFGRSVWRSLDPPPLAILRRQLTASTAWIVVALALEVSMRLRAGVDALVPDPAGLRAAHTLALASGVLGWVLGVLLRAAPMFVPAWNVPVPVARALPFVLGAGGLLAAAGELAHVTALARLGDAAVLAGAVLVLHAGGVFRQAPKALPIVSRSPEEARIVRFGALVLMIAAAGALATMAAAFAGSSVHTATDAVRHLFTVGFLTAIVVGMAFRLIPVLEWSALPWPSLRRVAFLALVGAVVLRTAEVVVLWGLTSIAPAVALSGVLAWLAVACVAVNLVGAIARRDDAGTQE